MLIMDENYLSGSPKITWAALFPRKTFCTPLKNAMKKSSPEEIKKYLRPEEGEEMQKVIVRMLIPEKYRRMSDGTDITDKEKTQFSRYFTHYKDNFGQNQYETVKKHVLKDGKAGKWDFDTFPFIQELKGNLKSLFGFFQEGFTENYKKDVIQLINLFDRDPILKDFKKDFLRADFYSQLTSLTAIAATWHCWLYSENDAADLSLFLIPYQSGKNNSAGNEWLTSYIEAEESAAAELLGQARELFFEQKDYRAAGDLCSQVIRKNMADESVLGEACYLLALCCLDHGYPYGGKLSCKKLLLEAVEHGYILAQDRLRRENGEPTPISLLRPIASTHGTARIILNSNNEYSAEFLKSIPREMQRKDVREKMIVAATSPRKLVESINPNEDCRYLLVDNDQEKNFQDLLFILDKISALEKASVRTDSVNASVRWSKTTIYIRVCEDSYSPLIDTALKRLGDFTVRVFTIDDNKWAAQYLLNRNPLFKQIEHLSAVNLNNKPVTINFTIISQGNTDLTCWLIREAFWLGCFHYSGISLAINLISPDAKAVESSLRFNCPDMFGELPDAELTSKVLPLNRLEAVDSVSSPDVISVLNQLNETANTYNYYAVNVGSDIENLNYGIKIREWSIRNLIETGKKPQNKSLPMISFYCKNSNIAHLSKNMVVQMIDRGDLWYNNYNLIPFGTLCDRYSWEQIDGGYLEKVAESTHLQYCGTKPSDNLENKILALKDYFSRSYNRDSSMAVALSMPYRLFQTAYSGKDHILPCADGSAAMETDTDPVRIMADRFRDALADPFRSEGNKKALLCYEHSRWLRWAISRGWKKASPDQVLNYMEAGNPKQQLYIARLHGCICGLEELQLLSEELCRNAETASGSDWERYAAERIPFYIDMEGDRKYISSYDYVPKDFTAIDELNIEYTGEIVTAAWLADITKVKEAVRL